jgi:hypothetical protein
VLFAVILLVDLSDCILATVTRMKTCYRLALLLTDVAFDMAYHRKLLLACYHCSVRKSLHHSVVDSGKKYDASYKLDCKMYVVKTANLCLCFVCWNSFEF